MATLRAQSRKFWPEYKAAGGVLVDYVLDMERALTPTTNGLLGTDTDCKRAQYDAIEADARFKPVLAELVRRGFGKGVNPVAG